MAKHELPTRPNQSLRSNRVSATIGPCAHCRRFVWDQLVDFQRWPEWIRHLNSVEQIDAGELGRGSSLLLKSGATASRWEVLFWDPLRRLDFEIHDHGARRGYSLQIDAGVDDEHVVVEFSSEVQFQGFKRLLSPFLYYLEKRRASQFFNELCEMLRQRAE